MVRISYDIASTTYRGLLSRLTTEEPLDDRGPVALTKAEVEEGKEEEEEEDAPELVSSTP